jgi:squalene-hopene/tetraprenyl-beta-curcumene cyclase
MSGSEGRLALVEAAPEEGLGGQVAQAIARATRYLGETQHALGYWQAPLEANVTMEAEYIFFNRILGREKPDIESRLADRLVALQQADGSWPQYKEGPGNLSTTIEAYFALKLTGHGADEPTLRRARDFILGKGGLARAGVFTRIWLSYFGQFPQGGVPAMPVELCLLPPWSPVNIYSMSSWARGTVVPLTLIAAHRPSVRTSADLGELWSGMPRPEDWAFARSPELASWRNFFLGVDRALKFVGQSPWKPLRRRAIARAIEWILRHQDTNGQWGGIQPAMINSTLALHAVGFAPDHPAIVSGIQGVEDFLIECDGTLMYQPCVSPNWDTALAAKALLDSGMDPKHDMLARAAEWLIAQQIFRPGDWSVYRPELEPGGWAFEFANDHYPDTDDTSVILMVLRDLPVANTQAGRRAITRGLNWVLGMQSIDGGYAAFDVNNSFSLWNRIPFADMEAMIDPPTEDITGRLLHCMGGFDYGMDYGRARRAVEYLRRTQRPDGSWWGRWGVNFVYGTWAALAGLEAIGEDMRAPYVRRAVDWITAHQNADGGWGETIASYDDESLAGKGESTASQTAWALLGLLAADGPHGRAVERGIDWLVRRQGPDGTWEERLFTGTGFPRHFYLRYHLYRHYFPLMALGQYRSRLGAASGAAGAGREGR